MFYSNILQPILQFSVNTLLEIDKFLVEISVAP